MPKYSPRFQPAGFVILLVVTLILFLGVVVDVNVDRLVEHGDLIGELAPGEVVLEAQFVLADDPARLPYAHQRRRGDVLHVFAAGHVLAIERQVLLRELAAAHHAVAEAAAAQGVHVKHVSAVEHADRPPHLEQPRQVPIAVTELAVGDRLLEQLLLIGRTGRAGIGICLGPIDAGEKRAKRRRHDVRRVSAGFTARNAAQVGQDGVAGGVDERFGPKVLHSFDVVRDHAANAPRRGRPRRRRLRG